MIDAPIINMRDCVGEMKDAVVVCDHHDGTVGSGRAAADEFHHAAAEFRIKRARWLIAHK